MTAPLARALRPEWRPAALTAVKALHTAIFASVGVAIAVFVWDGIRGRRGRRAALALGVALGETAIYASNNQVCPLTPLAEELGADGGSVADMFLPGWLSRRIPLIGGTALVVGLALNLRAALSRPAGANTGTSERGQRPRLRAVRAGNRRAPVPVGTS